MLGLIGVGCAFMLGRSGAIARQGRLKKSSLYTWLLRTAACMVAVWLRHPLDVVDILVWSLAAASIALGFWHASRPRREEDLTGTMFPDGQ